MNDINLIPDRILYRNRRIAANALKILLGIIGVILVLALFSIRTYQRMDLEKKVQRITSQISQRGLAELEQAEANLIKLQAESKKIDKTYNSISQGKLIFSELLTRVTSLMPPAVTVQSIDYSGEADSLVLNVKSTNPQLIALFLKRLHDDPVFVNIYADQVSESGGEFNSSIQIDMKEAGKKN